LTLAPVKPNISQQTSVNRINPTQIGTEITTKFFLVAKSLIRSKTIAIQVSKRVSLRTALIAPFVLQIFTVAGVLGYLSFTNSQKAVNDVAAQLRSEISDRIKQNLDNYLNSPHYEQMYAKCDQRGI
jgi:hypothetical protein